MSAETLRKWVRQAEVDAGETAGVPTETAREMRELRRKNRELEQTIEILKAATTFLRAGVRPATPLICAFIDEHAEEFGVVPICRALAVHGVQIAPRTYWAHRSAGAVETGAVGHHDHRDPVRCLRARREGKRPPESLYGSLKMWAHLQRQGIPVARCTVERIMRGQRLARGDPRPPGPHHRGRSDRTIGRPIWCGGGSAWRRPDALHVADFTYVPMAGGGFGYTAFVIDAYAGLIPGWECSLTKNTAFVERAIRAAAARRAREGHPLDDTIHHSDYAEVCVKPRICGDGLRSWGLLVDFSA